MNVRKTLLILLFLLVVAVNGVRYWLSSETEEAEPPVPVSVATQPKVVPPPPEMLGQGVRMPTPEELEDEARFTAQQVEKIKNWVADSSVERRVAGVEQLAAYQTPESEASLVGALALDFDPEVRRMSAQSLASFKEPTEKTVKALVDALHDDEGRVQVEALNTLMVYVSRMPNASPAFKALYASLSKQAKSKDLKNNTRKILRAFLQDQLPSAAVLGGTQ